jgi:TolA-binding protein
LLTIVTAVSVAAMGCAAEDPGLRQELDALRAEMRTLQRESAENAKRLEALAARVEQIQARPAERPAPAPAAERVVPPPDLAVVKVTPRAPPPAPSAPRRTVPPVPTAIPLAEPDPAAVEALRKPGRSIAAEAAAALEAARKLGGVAGARALEQFADRYPSHPAADNALLDAGRARLRAGDDEGGCSAVARVVATYPAGDALPDGLEELAACESRRGHPAEARRLVERLTRDFPDTPAARRARQRLAAAAGGSPAGSAASERQGAVP